MKIHTFRTGAVIAVMTIHTFAFPQVLSFLVREWLTDGVRFCQYDNGTVLNVGINLCPLSIRAS